MIFFSPDNVLRGGFSRAPAQHSAAEVWRKSFRYFNLNNFKCLSEALLEQSASFGCSSSFAEGGTDFTRPNFHNSEADCVILIGLAPNQSSSWLTRSRLLGPVNGTASSRCSLQRVLYPYEFAFHLRVPRPLWPFRL
jgi:hypothetical protein